MISRLGLMTYLIFQVTFFANAQAPEITFEARFDSTLLTTDNEAPVISSGLHFEDGISGKAVVIGTGDILQYSIHENISSLEGSLSVWVRPSWNPGDTLYRLMVFGTEPGNFEMHVDESAALVFVINIAQTEGKPIKGAFGSAADWRANNWYALTFTWDSAKIKLFVNGIKVAESEVGYDIPLVDEAQFHLGSLNGDNAFRGAVDELRIYDKSLSDEEIQMQYETFIDDLPLANAITITDIFGRDITDTGLTLLDWEGPIRNPAFKYFLQGDESLVYPLIVNLSTQDERTYFNLPSTVSPNGPAKSVSLTSAAALDSILFSTYMDQDFKDENIELRLEYLHNGIPTQQLIPVHIMDQDYDRPLSYPVVVDFSEAIDSFMLNPMVQEVITKAAEDWLYYVDGERIDSIEAGGSFLHIGGQDHNFEEKTVNNPLAYKGYYLYAYENTNEIGPCICSTGAPNRDLLQTSNGAIVPIPRIGGLHLNKFGQAYDSPPTGWEVMSPYENWTFADYVGSDIYSLAKHEIGHAMVFEEIPLYVEAQQRLGFISPALTDYYQDTIVPLFPWSTAHLFGILDPASLTPPYGGGVDDPVMPGGREMLTKLDVLIMESVGYPLRENEVTRELTLTQENSFEGFINQAFEVQLDARGGIPIYHFGIDQGELPPGLVLDVYTGKITGTPTVKGEYPIRFFVRDYDERKSGKMLETRISVFGEGSSDADLISFEIESQIGESLINDSMNTVHIVMPSEVDLSSLAPNIVISSGATVTPGNAELQDFTEPVEYLITSENGAVRNSWIITITVDNSTGLENHFLTPIALYPNPLITKIKLEFQLKKPRNTSLNIFDLVGQLIEHKKLGNIQHWDQWLDLAHLNPGIYFLHVVGDAETVSVRKIIKL